MTELLNAALVLAPIVVPLLAAGAGLLVRGRPGAAWVATAGAAGMLAAALALAVPVTAATTATTQAGPVTALGGLLAADALSAFMLVVIGAVALIAALATPGHLRVELAAGRIDATTRTRHLALVQLFLAAMALAVLAAGLGLLWVAVELTTVVTAFLVGQGRGRRAAEAAWKYVIICSTGIALALLGTFLLNAAAERAGASLDWLSLTAAGPDLDPGVTRIAVVLLVLGFGTKAGLAPMHAWLPDAHSQAPAPVSALMSGVLISVAFYAVLRVKVVADLALGPDFTRALLIVLALASIALAASLLIAQRDYKRMLAYSSIENMGLLALGAAIGSPLAIAAVLLHILGHGLVKSGLFVAAGRILQLTGTSRIDHVRGLVAREPVLGWCFGLGILAIVAFPPFSLFASELGIARAGFAAGLGWVTAAALLLVLVCAAALIGHTSRMLLGAPAATADGAPATTADGAPSVPPTATPVASPGAESALVTAVPVRADRRLGADRWVLIGALAAAAVVGITLGPLDTLLAQAAAIVAGSTP